MLTSKIQYNAANKAASELQAAIDAPSDPKLSNKIVQANIRKLKRKLEKIEHDIAEFEDLQISSIDDIKYTNLREMMEAPIKYRLIKKESLDDFAAEVGISRRQLVRYEAEDYKSCPVATLTQIFERLGASVQGALKQNI